jgi:hypothetical protein
MTDYSRESLKELAQVRINSVGGLLRAIARTKRPLVQAVENKYREDASDFRENLRFLCKVNWIDEGGGLLRLTEPGKAGLAACQSATQLRGLVLQALSAKDSPYKKQLVDYLKAYEVEDGNLSLRQTLTERARSASVRDLLMDLRAVEYSHEKNSYRLRGYGVDLYVWSRNEALAGASRRLRARIDARNELGMRAELAVVEFEKERLGPSLESRVDRISEGNPFASYDIQSLTVTREGTEARYIEVKAISADSQQFFWTRAEVETAQLLGPKYFLYLVPAAGGRVDVARLLIVNDPYKTVYVNRDKWDIVENVVVCSPARNA